MKPGIVDGARTPRAPKVVDQRRIAFCRSVKLLMLEQGVTFRQLAATTRAGVSDEYVSNLLDERRTDCEVQLRDVAAWQAVLGRAVLDAFLVAYAPGFDLVERAPESADQLALLSATGTALGAASELAATVARAAADGIITSAESAEIHAVTERTVPKLRAVAGAARAAAPKKAAVGR